MFFFFFILISFYCKLKLIINYKCNSYIKCIYIYYIYNIVPDNQDTYNDNSLGKMINEFSIHLIFNK